MKHLKKFPVTGLILGLLIGLAWTGCESTHKAAGRKLEAEGITLTYTDKAQAGGEIADLTLQHPLAISERQMLHHMMALNYEAYSLLGRAGPVFTKEDIQRARRLLTKALNKAHPQNIIGFEVESAEGTTKGQLFATPGKLHWRLTEIQGVKYSLTRNQMARYGTAWRLVPGKGQRLYVTEKLMGGQQWTNWIEASIDLEAPSNLKSARPKKETSGTLRPPSEPQPSHIPPAKAGPPTKDPADLEEKLKFLKYLYENQLIDQTEYEKKRKDLLDEYL